MIKFKISLAPSVKTRLISTREATLDELAKLLTEFQPRPQKDGPAWSPIAWSGNTRSAENFESACALAFDCDWDKESDFDGLVDRLETSLESMGCAYIIHETFSSTEKLRVVIPTASAMNSSQYVDAWFYVRDRLGVPVDEACKDLARLFYLPSHAPGESRQSVYKEGKLFEVSSIQKSPSVDLFELRRAFSKEPKILEVLNLKKKVPPGERHNFGILFAYKLLVALPAMRLREKALAVFDFVSKNCIEVLDDSELSAVYEDMVRAWEHASKKLNESSAVISAINSVAAPDEWRSSLMLNNKGQVLATTNNLLTYLRNGAGLGPAIKFNELTKKIEVAGGPMYGRNGSSRENIYESNLDLRLISLAEKDLGVSYSRQVSSGALLLHARENSYNPVITYLKGLRWDGVPRIGNVLLEYARAVGRDEYIKLITEKFFVGAVARALDPGCKVDTVLVLQGPQGIKKSSFVETLGGEHYTCFHGRIDEKDGVRQATESWIVELSELASLPKSSTETLRGFLTQSHDTMRLPYSTNLEKFPRRCVFIGTTNDSTPLSDSEGNRRFWVVSVGAIDTQSLAKMRDQLFAEAVVKFNEYLEDADRGVPSDFRRNRWWLDSDEQEVSDKENAVYFNTDTIETTIYEWQMDSDSDLSMPLSKSEIVKTILRLPSEKATDNSMNRRIGSALKRLGWTKEVYLGIIKYLPPSSERQNVNAKEEAN